MEFESVSLRVEKVIGAGSTGVVNVRPLSPGRYEFYDDFHQETRGFLWFVEVLAVVVLGTRPAQRSQMI